jgi:hypothetical protein
MKRFMVFNTSDETVALIDARSIDDVEKHPKFIEAMKHQNGRLFTIVEIAQTKRYERPL